MNLPDTNIYRRCRARTRKTQEQWAEQLGISVESVKRYELGQATPGMWVVRRMIEESGYDALALQHVYQVTAELEVLPDVQADTPLSIATIRVINRVATFVQNHRDRQLMAIAEDGVIDEAERALFDDIMGELRELAASYYGIRYAAEENVI